MTCSEHLMIKNEVLPVSAELTLNEIVAAKPQALTVFHRLGLDTCCGGAKSLHTVCVAHQIDLDALLRELRALP
ncbi:MAG: DUF542 domain-containing protein [Gemmatimonadaceae bacterium]|nr:DUF542 domain-containing protein [Gemmatimonadaceae bacterium]